MLVAIDDARLMVHEVVESRQALRISAPVGSELPLVRSSAARAIAAHLPPRELAALRRAHPGLDDDRALTVAAVLLHEDGRVRLGALHTG